MESDRNEKSDNYTATVYIYIFLSGMLLIY